MDIFVMTTDWEEQDGVRYPSVRVRNVGTLE